MQVDVTERGERILSPTEWRRLAAEPTFWEVVRRGVLAIKHEGPNRVVLTAGNQVGRLLVGDIRIDVPPKVPSALEALLAAAHPSLKLLPQHAPATTAGDLMHHLVSAFVTHVRSYAGRGREWRYVERREHGSLIGGRLDVPRTATLRARGARHLAAFRRPLIDHVTPLNVLLYAALAEITRLARLVALDPVLVNDARGLALLFDDCAAHRTLYGGPAALLPVAHELLETEDHEDRVTLLELAVTVLAHLSFEVSGVRDERVPIAWLVNMEVTFEDAVRRCLARSSRNAVTKGWRHRRYVLPVGDVYRANPDLTIGPTPCLAVGDVKYKTWTGSADASDVYQLLSHARALESTSAFLVYPHDADDVVDLGSTSDGIRTRLFAVDIRDLDAGSRRLLVELGLPTKPMP